METHCDPKACNYNLLECPYPMVHFVADTADHAKNPPVEYKWSHMFRRPPAIGERVTSKAHKNLTGTVTGYFVEYGWIGLHVKLDTPYVNGNGKSFEKVHVFGIDLA